MWIELIWFFPLGFPFRIDFSVLWHRLIFDRIYRCSSFRVLDITWENKTLHRKRIRGAIMTVSLPASLVPSAPSWPHHTAPRWGCRWWRVEILGKPLSVNISPDWWFTICLPLLLSQGLTTWKKWFQDHTGSPNKGTRLLIPQRSCNGITVTVWKYDPVLASLLA